MIYATKKKRIRVEATNPSSHNDSQHLHGYTKGCTCQHGQIRWAVPCPLTQLMWQAGSDGLGPPHHRKKDVSWHSTGKRCELALHFLGSKKSFHRLKGVFVECVIHRGVISIECLQLCPIPAGFVDLSGHPPRSWKSVTPIWRSSVERPGTWALKWAQLGYPQRWCDDVTWHPEDVSLTPLHINTLLYNLLVGMKLLGWVTERSSCCPYLFLGHPKNYMFWRPEDGCQISILDPTSASILMRLWKESIVRWLPKLWNSSSPSSPKMWVNCICSWFLPLSPLGLFTILMVPPCSPPFFKAVHGESFAGIYTLQGSIIEISSPPIAWWIRPRPNTRRSLAVHWLGIWTIPECHWLGLSMGA